jgi:flagellar protein FlgJ
MLNATKTYSNALALDTQGLGDLRQAARNKSPEALKEAATQFEAMFVNMMMKSMREATPQDSLNDSQTSKTFTSMLDQQLSQTVAKRGVGLADMLIKQLSAQQGNAQALAIGGEQVAAAAPLSIPFAAAPKKEAQGRSLAPLADAAHGASSVASAGASAARKLSPHVAAFRDKLGAHAEAASRATGIPAKFMLGQAALESGWGRREIRNPDGSPSNNLFGIKAGPGWKGKVTTAVTTEYVNGVPRTRVERFRAYDSYADSFKDYARLISNNPRYEKVMASAGDAAAFARGLQNAGYATDPFYAAKLTRIINHSLA